MSDKANEIDAIDLRLLRLLQADCRRSTTELADVLGVSQPVVWRRMQRLREAGFIDKEVAILNRTKLGLNAQVYALVKLSSVGRANLALSADTIRSFPEVVECYVLMGSADFLLKVITPDIHAYERFFFERLSRVEGVQDVTSSVALSEIKPPSGLPI